MNGYIKFICIGEVEVTDEPFFTNIFCAEQEKLACFYHMSHVVV